MKFIANKTTKKQHRFPVASGYKLYAAVSILMIFATCLTAQVKKPFSVRGEISGLNGGKAYLRSVDPLNTYVDSAQISGGGFTFKGIVSETFLYGLQLPNRKYLSLGIQPGDNVTIKGSEASLADVKIDGASAQPIWNEWQKGWSAITARAGVLYKMLDSVGKGDRSAVDAGFKDLEYRTDTLVTSVVKKYPSSSLSAFIITDRYINYPSPEKAERSYNLLSSDAKNSAYGKALAISVSNNAKTAVGVKPDFTLPDRDGKQLKLSSLKGKVVLVDFWASWCGPCRKENPNIVEAYSKYHNKGFEVLGVSLDNNKAAWLKAVDADKLSWLHVSDLKGWKSPIVGMYSIKSIPTSFLLDKSGKIIAKNLRGEALEKKLAEIFN